MRGGGPGIGGAGHRTPLMERMIDGKRLPLEELAGTGHREEGIPASEVPGTEHRGQKRK